MPGGIFFTSYCQQPNKQNVPLHSQLLQSKEQNHPNIHVLSRWNGGTVCQHTLYSATESLFRTQGISSFLPWEITGRKGNRLIWQLIFNCLWFIWHLYHPHTSARHPKIWSRHRQTSTDTIQTPPQTFYILEGTGRKGNTHKRRPNPLVMHYVDIWCRHNMSTS